MRRFSTAELGRYLLNGHVSTPECLLAATRRRTRIQRAAPASTRSHISLNRDPRCHHHTAATGTTTPEPANAPYRKQLKDEAKQFRKEAKSKKSKGSKQVAEGWELTVGIEIHAQLNTSHKLFSPAATSFNDDPNSHVALFDVAMPGAQPLFQQQTLIPALRAALALDCDIQPVSRFDRKHYFWWDQPSGYQITQYYEPFARNGQITLYARDGIAPEDGDSVTIGIQQVQMEQDTAKTMVQPDDISWLDFNRVGVPLIEIITKPELHHPKTAAVLVKKLQVLLNAVDACVSGMETGGLRADVNVSVRRTGDPTLPLGTRTEIKNLSTIRAVEDAIIAERDRQIKEIEAGGTISGETRGWTLGSKQTRRLRGKEGEVDYRYMPDPDLAPLVISNDLVLALKQSVANLPDHELTEMVNTYGITAKDSVSLMSLDNGGRLEYFYNVVDDLGTRLSQDSGNEPLDVETYAPLAANWILHELGRLTVDKSAEATAEVPFEITADGRCSRVPVETLAELLFLLHQQRITGKVAKELLMALYHGNLEDFDNSITAAVDSYGLWFQELSQTEYDELAESVLEGEEQVINEFREKAVFPQGKLMYLVGKMLRTGATERMNPANAERTMRAKIEALCK